MNRLKMYFDEAEDVKIDEINRGLSSCLDPRPDFLFLSNSRGVENENKSNDQ